MHSPMTEAPMKPLPNGAALAAALGAGIGAFALGLLVLANETKVFVAPSLYAGAGGLSGRSTFAVVAWLAAWLVLHRIWRDRELRAGPVLAWTFGLTALSVLATLPTVWALL